MVLKNMNSILTIVFYCILVLYSVKVAAKKSSQKPIFSEIVKNISRVNHLLQDLIKNYIQLEELSRPKNGESDYKTDTEIEDLFDGDMNNRVENKSTTEAINTIGTPFSDKSVGNTEEISEKEEQDSDDTSDSLSSDSDDTSSSDLTSKSNSTEEILTGRPKEQKGADGAKVMVIHLANSKNPNRKANERNVKYKTKNTVNKIPKAEVSKSEASILSDEKDFNKKLVIRAKSDDDVCMKAVVRKCSKALSQVLKDTCSKRKKCAGQFKDEFKKNSNTGCLKQFKGQSVCRIGDNPRRNGERMVDLKKQYLRMTCLRTLTNIKEPADSPDRPESSNADPKYKQVNILRNRYEKACQKKSYTKCRDACTYAIIKTCKKYDCPTVKENFMDKSCRKRCRESYKYTGHDSGDDDDDDDDDDDSSSDSD